MPVSEIPPPVSSRRASHRRRQPRPPALFLDDVAGVLLVPLTVLTAVWALAVLAAWLYELPVSQLTVALGAGIVIAAVTGAVRARSVAAHLRQRRDGELEKLTKAVQAAENTVVWTAGQLCRGEKPPLPDDPLPSGPDPLGKALEMVAHLKVQGAGALLRVQEESRAAVQVEMHRVVARRQHGLISEMLGQLSELHATTEEPELLDRSFRIDHLATRLRRMVESLSVVLGGQYLRETRAPVQVGAVLRGALSEVVKYTRVQIVAGPEGASVALPAHVHPDVAHMLAELVDNGLENSDPATPVTLRAQRVARGLLIEVEDRATRLMDPGRREQLNTLLEHPGRADVAGQVRAGCLGLITTAMIAAKYGIRVRLEMNAMGGTTAQVVIPHTLLLPVAPAVTTITVPTTAAPAVLAPCFAPAPAERLCPHPAPATVYSGSAGADGAEPLPRRRRAVRPLEREEQPRERAIPAPNPRVAADWRAGLQAGHATDTIPGPGGSRPDQR